VKVQLLPGFIALLYITLTGSAAGADSSRPITVWLIPGEEAEARAGSDTARVDEEIREFNHSLELTGGRVRVLNALPPLDAQLIVWNSAFALPNWAWVRNQTETIRALQRFAKLNDVKINVRFETWDKAFSDINLPRRADTSNPPPDLVQIGTTWAAYLASRRLVVTRPEYQTRKGAWQAVVGQPAAVLPYINDVRLLFYWKRLPGERPSAQAVTLNTSSWSTIIESLHTQGTPEDRIAFAGGLTLNLLMDYSMMVWAGGADPIASSRWGAHADLTSANALRVPELLARAADGAGGRRRLIVVPESSHQALTQAFAGGEYRATIEPSAFVSRWKKDFDKTFTGSKRFWDYAAAAVPPSPFLGGSYLAVMPSPELPAKAFELADFLATDEQYTRVLGRNGHLPSLRPGYGMDVLLEWLGGSNSNEAEQFTSAVQQASVQGRKLPDLPNWPADIESTEVQEAFQRVWRRIGDGNIDGLRREAAATEALVNLKVDRLAQFTALMGRYWWLPLLILFAFVAMALRYHGMIVEALAATKAALTKVEEALEQAREALFREELALQQVRTLRGFSANALLALGRYHTLGIYGEVSDSPSDAKKRSIIAAGIQGWRRGRNPGNWMPAPVLDVIWRSVLLAFDLVHEPDLYERWEKAGKVSQQNPRVFLTAHGYLRESPVSAEVEPSYFVQIVCPDNIKIHSPFLLEQALASVFQNAIQASDDECGRSGPRKPIIVSATPSQITVINAGEPFPSEIRHIVNENQRSEDFEDAVLTAVRSAKGKRPGIGLTEAYAIARHCYGGMEIADDAPAVTIHLSPVKG
jgi:hypothetical protein